MTVVKVNKKDMPRAFSPACSLCRKLIREGYSEDTVVEVYGEHEDWDYRITDIWYWAYRTIKEEPKIRYIKLDNKIVAKLLDKNRVGTIVPSLQD